MSVDEPATLLSDSAPAGESGEIAQAVRLTVTRIARRLRQQDRTGLGATATSVLATIRRHGEPTHGELAALEQLAPPTITSVIGKMEARGFVVRETDANDRRVTRIRLTPAGTEQLDDVRTRRTEWIERQVRALSVDELARLADALDVLSKLAEMNEE